LQCRINPTGELYFDGMTLGPYDVLFVKLKRLMLEGRTPGTTTALRYQTWMAAVVKTLANLNTWQLCKSWFVLCEQNVWILTCCQAMQVAEVNHCCISAKSMFDALKHNLLNSI
jgi:hypothetical protein